MYVPNETRQPGLITALRRGPTSSTRWAGTSEPKRTLDCASPTAAALAIGKVAACFLRPVSASACISALSSAAPRSMFVSTYSGTTSKSSPGKTTRCSTRGTRWPWSASVALFMSAVSVCKRGLGVERSTVFGDGWEERSMVFEKRSQAVLEHGQRGADRHVHVEVLIRAEPPAEEHALLAVGHLAVGQQARPVLGRVDRVVRLVAVLGEPRVLPHDHGLVRGVPLPFRVEVPELVDAGERDVGVRVVHDRRALEVAGGQDLQVEVEGTPAQVARRVVEVRVERAGIHDGHAPQKLGSQAREIGVQPHLDLRVIDHALQPGSVAVDRKPLEGVIEVSVVACVTHG